MSSDHMKAIVYTICRIDHVIIPILTGEISNMDTNKEIFDLDHLSPTWLDPCFKMVDLSYIRILMMDEEVPHGYLMYAKAQKIVDLASLFNTKQINDTTYQITFRNYGNPELDDNHPKYEFDTVYNIETSKIHVKEIRYYK
jgi:hypothetical protein